MPPRAGNGTGARDGGRTQCAAAIGDYAVIGDCRSAALISLQGSLDWLCLPEFASPSIFGALLSQPARGGTGDPDSGTDDSGRFAIRPAVAARVSRRVSRFERTRNHLRHG
jgi:GH15 family glucan-1,4-alpha-glucosidase